MEELIIKAKQGDKEAFSELILLIKNDLYKIAKTRISDEEEIKDILQDTYIIAYKNIKKLKDTSKFKYWIIKILINKCKLKYKKIKKHNDVCENIDLEKEYKYLNIKINDNELIEDTINFYNLLNGLEKDEKTILVLYYGEEYTTKEISKLLHINENTIKSKIARAKQKIKKKINGGENYGSNR